MKLTGCKPGWSAIICAISAANGLFGRPPGAGSELLELGTVPDVVDVVVLAVDVVVVVSLGAVAVVVDEGAAGVIGGNPNPRL